MLNRNYKETLYQFVASDEVFSFVNTIKRTPAYWKIFFLDVLAVIKELELSTFFLTFSCADLRCNELISIISKLEGNVLSDEQIQNLSFQDRYKCFKKNHILIAIHFQCRVEMFFK